MVTVTYTSFVKFEGLNEKLLLAKIISMQEPYPLKQLFLLIKFSIEVAHYNKIIVCTKEKVTFTSQSFEELGK